MSNGNDLKRTCAQFTYLKCMIMCLMKKKLKRGRKKQEKEDEKRKSTSIFRLPSEKRMWILEFACYLSHR